MIKKCALLVHFLMKIEPMPLQTNTLKTTDSFFFVSENNIPKVDSANVFLEKKIDGCQMVLNELSEVSITEEIVLLGDEHINEIYDLVWLVMPGYYRRRTFEMGNYYGIFKEGKLVSITGQRMQTNLLLRLVPLSPIRILRGEDLQNN